MIKGEGCEVQVGGGMVGKSRSARRCRQPYRIVMAGLVLVWACFAGVVAWAQESETPPTDGESLPVLKLSLTEAVDAALNKSPSI
ncbi:MAG: hypothetical protein OEY86_11885, partial [Nitrospira sp.]|nr:hypothetical protein [Nitrospira sp.]